MLSFDENIDVDTGNIGTAYYFFLSASLVSALLWYRKRSRHRIRNKEWSSGDKIQSREESLDCNTTCQDFSFHMKKRLFYKALPKMLHVRIPFLCSRSILREILNDLASNGVMYAELEVDADPTSSNRIGQIQEYIASLCQVLQEFENEEKYRVHLDRRQYYSSLDNSADDNTHDHDSILRKYRLALTPRMILNISSVQDANALLPFISDPFTNSWISTVVGVSLNSNKVHLSPFSAIIQFLKSAKEHGLRVQLHSVMENNLQDILDMVEVDRISAGTENDINSVISTKLNHIPISVSLEMLPMIKRAISTNDQPFVLSVTYCIESRSARIVSCFENEEFDGFITAKLCLDSFHNVLESSRRTRSEIVKAATTRTNQLILWVSRNKELAEP